MKVQKYLKRRPEKDIEASKTIPCSKREMKYQPEDYRKTFKELNLNRKRIRLFANKVVPYQGYADYSVSKNIIKEIQTKFNFEDVTQRNILTSNSFYQIKLHQTEENLRRIKEEESRRRKMLNDKWKDLHKKENDLKKSFIEFDEFIIQNEEKRKRATEKISKAKLLLTEKSQQIEELEKKYDQCKELKEILDNDIKNHSYIEKYLLSVVNKNHKKFSTIEDLLKRFDALLEARQILSNVFERYLTQMEETKDAVNKMVMVKCVEIAGLRNTLTDLHNRFETARQSCANWEQYHHKIVLEAMTKVMEIQSVKDSIWQIYEDICKRKGVETVYRGNYAKQLEIIKKALLKFNLVNKMAKALEVPSDNASSTDSIVVSVVKKVSKKLGDKSKSFARQREKNKRQESTSDLRVLQNLFANAPSTQKILIGNLDKRTQQHSIEENGRQSYGHGSSSDSYLGNLENHIHEQQLGHSSTFILDRHSSEYLSRRKSLIDFEEETLDEIPNKLLLNLKEKNSKIQRRFSTSS